MPIRIQESRFARSTLMTAATLALLVGSGEAAKADQVKIGLLAPLTGPASADGQEFQRGAQLAIDEVNAAGGINGHTFELVVGDVKDQSAGNVTSAVERLLGDQDVHFMMTGYASLTNFEIENMAEAEMPYVLAANSQQTKDIIAEKPEDYACCWSWTPSFDAYNTDVTSFAEKLAADGKITLPTKKVAIVSSDNAYSKTISEGMKKTFTEKGWTITVDEIVPFGDVTDWRSILAKVRQDPPDVVINTDYLPGNSASFLTQFLEQPTKSLVFLQYAPSVPEFVELTGAKSNGVVYDLLGGPLFSPQNPRADEVAKKFKDEYGVESGTYGLALYEIANLYFDALKSGIEPDDHAAVMDALAKTDKQVVAGRLKFDPATHLAMQGDDYIPITFFQIWDGSRVLISPEKYATGEFKPRPWMQ
ncbi:MAG TPA: ABC transporter substrate-binding protein [Geminicoccus sp.]|jgi:branched-chain amino acid transport system substrate-binding protein|uniref:ABC transporter substrate-binding protein n=1 Tax=Geminicoccus sp. TaxID=2024832 RepID=UPI002E377A4B|nr:ABC transporter substrate-binding protein [Geminicoccus sp.]HEX2528141.1 ABC transporter substrate-binding protein [Geminicoccus sp.]